MIRAHALIVLVVLTATAARGQPVITEVAWMGSDASFNDEWIEIHNPDAQPVEAGDFVLIQGGTVRPLPSGQIADGGFLVLERTAQATPLEPPTAVTFALGALANDGQTLCLCASTATSCADASCDVVNPAGAAWFAGSNTAPKQTMERVDPALPGSVATSWQDGSPSSPGALSPAPLPDAGVIVDAGNPDPVVDAGPNTLPTLSITEPAGLATGASVTVVYSADDPDDRDEVTVELYWSVDDVGQDGVLFAQGLPGGASRSATFDTTGVPPGTVHIFGRARDTRGGEVYAYAPGQVEVAGGGPQDASFEVTEPDGVNDGEDDGTFTVEWSVSLPAGQSGAISLFVDDDDSGEDGEPLIGGLSAAADGPRAFRWDPVLTGTPAGEAHVYGVLEHGGGRIVSYAPAGVTIAGDGCACTDRGSSAHQSLLGGLALAILLLRVAGSRSARSRPR